ncbi:hypothetical protein KORDIASMS9_01476 [Kordia sp. SMS9]|uniref:hypothetical protein n=1 Tax=Kordia sp. SMS9 TaxID=2282170 RepID=UPI000E0DC48F|nr:hypothetical protein [Kordia sp. SMS9]AXG69256.1 hypothetical protein KORDIASMS9_01476 [Kordia sp. SMS9]
MTQENYIVDTQLPLELDFEALKAAGLAYIQEHSDKAWTNLNPSDPGVTILEQLCYAFTELGYCANFSIKDILTAKNGDLTVENQFYLPQNILTTSSITVNDYIKFIIDEVPSVKNVVILPISLTFPFVNGIYQVYLLLDPNYSNPSVIDAPISETLSVLNSRRNLGELFLQPQLLSPKEYTVSGTLELQSGYDFNSVLPEIMQSINNYIFPEVTQTGYDMLKVSGEKTNAIFNGPSLKNGWIPSESIQPKRNTIYPFEITQLIKNIDGVQTVSGISFTYKNAPKNSATCEQYEILTFSVLPKQSKDTDSTDTSGFSISMQGKKLNTSLKTSLLDELANMQQPSSQINEVASVQIAPKVPTGKYRDITSYYSIQHTFPEAYAVGLNAVNDSMPAYQIAQSRQLKGYLSLFDQMLSNQFAQLANIDKLFSFKNAITGTPSDLEQYNNIKSKEEKAHPKYPAPFEVFSPTYFYQSLYKSVPNVQPLLRNNSIFKFGPVSQSQDELTYQNWLEYQDDPYNSYMYGLLVFSEDDTVNLQRRNDLLNHLLARHGESPLVMDTLVFGTVYSGNIIKDRVIIKSVYLQNLQVLSYNRTKTYNCIGAAKLNAYMVDINATLIQQLANANAREALADLQLSLSNVLGQTQEQIAQIKAEYLAKKELYNILTKTYKSQGVFNVKQVNKLETITTQDCLDYATISLKLSMLLTLKPIYINFIQCVLDGDTEDMIVNPSEDFFEESALTLWLLTERKGMISIETNLLLQSGTFQLYFQDTVVPGIIISMEVTLTYEEFMILSAAFDTIKSQDIDTFLQKINPTFTTTKIPEEELTDVVFSPIENSSILWAATVSWNGEHNTDITDSLFQNTLLWIFPDYIKELQESDWQHRLSYFMESQLPIHISAHPMPTSADDLKTLIPLYVTWYNANIYAAPKPFETVTNAATTRAQKIVASAGNLVTQLKTIYKDTNA